MNKFRLKHLALTFLLGLMMSPIASFGQIDLTTHFLDTIAQANYTNPALFPNSKAQFTIFPSLAWSIGNSGFAYRNMIRTRADDSLYLDIPGVLAAMENENDISFHTRTELLRIQFRIKQLHFHFGTANNSNINLGYTRGFADLIWNGNSSQIGQTVNLAPTLNVLSYQEASFGVGYKTKRLWAGVKAKYLIGIMNIQSDITEASLYTDPDIYQLMLKANGNIRVGSAFELPDFSSDSTNGEGGEGGSGFSMGNNGMAFDFGVVIKPIDRLKISASLIDIGKINWKENTNTYTIDGEFEFTGLGDLLSESDSSGGLIDSIVDIFKPETTEDEAYETKLNPKLYLSAQYEVFPKVHVGALFYGEFRPDRVRPAATFSVMKKMRVLHFGVTYSYRDNQWNNFGVAAALNLWKFQWFFTSDNVSNLFMPRRSKYFNFRSGFNFSFDKSRKKRARLNDE